MCTKGKGWTPKEKNATCLNEKIIIIKLFKEFFSTKRKSKSERAERKNKAV